MTRFVWILSQLSAEDLAEGMKSACLDSKWAGVGSSLVSSGWQDGRLDDCSLIVIQRLFFFSLPLPVLVPALREETASGESACTCHCLSGCLLISLPANDFESDEGGRLAGARRLLQRLTHFFFFATEPRPPPQHLHSLKFELCKSSP